MQTGFLTTHVLDTARGSPAGGLHITLFRLGNPDYKAVSTAVTNEDGRTDSPILTTDDFQTGRYRLVFHAGPYLNLHFSDLSAGGVEEELGGRPHQRRTSYRTRSTGGRVRLRTFARRPAIS